MVGNRTYTGVMKVAYQIAAKTGKVTLSVMLQSRKVVSTLTVYCKYS